LRLHQLEQGELQAQQFDIGGLVVARPLEQVPNTPSDCFSTGPVLPMTKAPSGAQDDHRLERLPQHFEVAAHGHVATEDTGKDDDDADYNPTSFA
jgi:hypothetical protein